MDGARPYERLLAGAVLCMASGLACAQQEVDPEGPVVVGERRGGLKFFTLERFDVALRFDTRYRSDRVRTLGQPTRRDTEEIYQENIDVTSRSFLGHRNLCDLTADFSVGWESTDTNSETTGIQQRDSGVITGYNINALILAQSDTPMSVYALSNRSLFDREFSGSIDVTSSEYGVYLHAFRDVAPTTFHYFHREQDEDDQLGLVNHHLTQDAFSVQTAWTPTDNQRLLVDYTFDIVDETQSVTFVNSYNRHDATITHTLDFGPEEEHNLRTTARIYDQDGPYGQSTYRLDESLRLQHTERFDTRYDLTLEQRSLVNQDQQRYRFSATARHKLFDSLITSANAGASRTELADDHFSSDEFFASLNLDYVKQVPYGRLDGAVGLNYDQVQNSDRGQIILIRDNRVTFTDPLPVIIARRNIIPGSVFVTDLGNSLIYVEGLDYTLRVFPDRIELRRIVGGAIADGESVLVDYDLGPEPANSITSLTHAITLRYTIEEGPLWGFSTYLTYSELNQDLEAADPSRFTLNDQTRLLLGAELHRGPVTLLVERDDVSSEVSPYSIMRVQARYDQRLGVRSWIALEATHETSEFKNTGSTIDLDRITAEIGKMLAPGLHGRLRLRYRDESDSTGPDTRGIEQIIELNYKRGQTDVYASIRNSNLEGDSVDTDSQSFSFGVRRAF